MFTLRKIQEEEEGVHFLFIRKMCNVGHFMHWAEMEWKMGGARIIHKYMIWDTVLFVYSAERMDASANRCIHIRSQEKAISGTCDLAEAAMLYIIYHTVTLKSTSSCPLAHSINLEGTSSHVLIWGHFITFFSTLEGNLTCCMCCRGSLEGTSLWFVICRNTLESTLVTFYCT